VKLSRAAELAETINNSVLLGLSDRLEKDVRLCRIQVIAAHEID
jgi:hypothetical protein